MPWFGAKKSPRLSEPPSKTRGRADSAPVSQQDSPRAKLQDSNNDPGLNPDISLRHSGRSSQTDLMRDELHQMKLGIQL
jgi:hypothetical protein